MYVFLGLLMLSCFGLAKWKVFYVSTALIPTNYVRSYVSTALLHFPLSGVMYVVNYVTKLVNLRDFL